MQTKRNRSLIWLPIGLLAVFGMLLLSIGFSGTGSVQARSNIGERGSSALTRETTLANYLKAPASFATKTDKNNVLRANQAGVQQIGPGNGPGLPGVPSGGAAAAPAGGAAAGAAAQGALDDILDAIDNTIEVDSYYFEYKLEDPFSGPTESMGQYVADDMVNVFVIDAEDNEREGIIFGENIYVRNDEGFWEEKTREELDEDTTPAISVIASFADTPNIFESLATYVPGAYDITDEGDVELSGATTRHYKFLIDGNVLLGTEDADEPFVIGQGEIFIDLSENLVYALNYDIDFTALLELIFGGFSDGTPTATPDPEVTPEPPLIITYNLLLERFDEEIGFAEPSIEDIATATEEVGVTETAAPTRTARPTRTPRVTQTPTTAPATNTPITGGDADQILGDAIDAMFDEVETYHFDLQTGYNYDDAEGYVYNELTTTSADVQNPDRLDITTIEEVNDGGEASVYQTDVIRIGDDVYIADESTQNEFEQYDINEIDPNYLYTVIDPRSVVDTIEQLDNEEINGEEAIHIVFTFDMQALYGDDFDLSDWDADGGGDAYISVDGGYLLEMNYHYYAEHLDTGEREDFSYNGVYSAFNEELDIQPPAEEEE